MTALEIINTEIPADILALSDGMLILELTGDPSFLTDDEILAELAA